MQLEVKIEADKLSKAFEEYGEELKGKLPELMLRAGKIVQGQAKINLDRHNDTGLLRRSISTRLVQQGDEVVVQIGTNVHYAIHVEFGHRTRLGTGKKGSKVGGIHYVAGVYFLRNALIMKRRQAVGSIIAGVRKW